MSAPKANRYGSFANGSRSPTPEPPRAFFPSFLTLAYFSTRRSRTSTVEVLYSLRDHKQRHIAITNLLNPIKRKYGMAFARAS